MLTSNLQWGPFVFTQAHVTIEFNIYALFPIVQCPSNKHFSPSCLIHHFGLETEQSGSGHAQVVSVLLLGHGAACVYLRRRQAGGKAVCSESIHFTFPGCEWGGLRERKGGRWGRQLLQGPQDTMSRRKQSHPKSIRSKSTLFEVVQVLLRRKTVLISVLLRPFQ